MVEAVRRLCKVGNSIYVICVNVVERTIDRVMANTEISIVEVVK